jgi:hypothetical protein
MLRKNRTTKHKPDAFPYHTVAEFDKCLFQDTHSFFEEAVAFVDVGHLVLFYKKHGRICCKINTSVFLYSDEKFICRCSDVPSLGICIGDE